MPPKKKAAKKVPVARAQRAVPRVEPEVVGSVAGMPLPQDPMVGAQIRLVLEMVVLRWVARHEAVENPGAWIEAVHAKLMFVSVTTLRELVMEAPTLNATLRQARQVCLNVRTISEMMAEVVELIEWPGDPSESVSSSEF